MKIGGSLAANPKTLKSLCNKIGSFGKNHELFIVPGGSRFADVARYFDKKYNLTCKTSHKMAILGMDQFGFILKELIPNSHSFRELDEYKKIINSNKIPVFLPSQYMFRENPLENSWSITSDSIAAHLAENLKITNIIIITDVDGLFTKDPKKIPEAKLIKKISPNSLLQFNQETCVDMFLAKLLIISKIRCFIVNGMYPKRIEAILRNQQTTSTLIF